MKNIIKSLVFAFALSITLTACAQNKAEVSKSVVSDKAIPQKEATLEMNKDTLLARTITEIEKEIVKRKIELTTEALATIGETQSLLQQIKNGERDKAVKKGKELIGNLEVLLAKDPDLALIPVDVRYKKEELITDIETVRKTVKAAQKAMDKGYYRVASDLLKDMRSEMVINTFLIPTTTYPEALKAAVILIEDNKLKDAQAVLEEMLGTIVVEKTVLPLPVLNAEQMIIEAANIDKENHDNADKVVNLLKNAAYQLQLAEELGYGKRDKDFATLSEAISALEKSVSNKENSESKFDKLKEDLHQFRERLFPGSRKDS